jgi:hypothetical protein
MSNMPGLARSCLGDLDHGLGRGPVNWAGLLALNATPGGSLSYRTKQGGSLHTTVKVNDLRIATQREAI